IEGLKALLRRFEQGTVRLHFADTVEPSVLAHEILNGAPFTYLDEDTEIGERRSRAVPLRRGLPVEPRELGRLDPGAIERVRAQGARPRGPAQRSGAPSRERVRDQRGVRARRRRAVVRAAAARAHPRLLARSASR